MSKSLEWKINARRPDGSVDVPALAKILHITEAELAAAVGLHGDPDSPEGQSQWSWLVELLEKVTPWAGDPKAAYAWYCSQPIVGFGDQTAQDLVQAGKASSVDAYLNRIADGGYA